MKFLAASFSAIGPRQVNEDCVGVWRVGDTLTAAVADGLGGMGGGAVASGLAIECLNEVAAKRSVARDDLRQIALEAHSRIINKQLTDNSLKSMATTFTAASFVDGHLSGVHCGDTRLLIARKQGIKRLSLDQTEGQRLFLAGKLSKQELNDYPRKHILDSALGVINKDLVIQGIDFDLEAGDKVLIVSDGVYQAVSMRNLRDLLADFSDPKEFVKELCFEIERRGASDNFSVVAVFANQ